MRGAIWKGSISFGLLNIPVSLQTAEQDRQIHFSLLDKRDLQKIKYQKINADSGKEVPWEQIVKGYEYESGQYVVITEKDFQSANVKATQTIDIEDFVALEEIDTLLFEKPYYLVPQKSGEKGYFLLREALEQSKKVAVGKVVIRTKQHLAAIMAREDFLVLEILRFAHEVKEIQEARYMEDVNTKVKFKPQELKMAKELIEGMTVKWDPDKYEDTYYNDMLKHIRRKVKAGEGHEVEEPKDDDVKPSRVVDIMPLLKKSLESRKAHKSRKAHARA